MEVGHIFEKIALGVEAAAICLLDATGTHTVLAMAQYGNNTGPFGLHLQSMNNPLNATPLLL